MMVVVLVDLIELDLIELRTAERWLSGRACLNCGWGHSLTGILDGGEREL